MRLLFCAVAAHGHVLPLAPLMAAAIRAGHRVALVTAPGLADVIATELPAGVEHLPAGPMPIALAIEAARRTGEDVMAPSARGIGETFGGVLLDLAADEALAAARAWASDVVLSEIYCTVGPLLAAALDVPLHEVRMTAPITTPVADAIGIASARRYERRGLRPPSVTSLLDLWPAAARDPRLTPPDDCPVIAVRGGPHRRSELSGAWSPASRAERPRVLVSLGTVFSSSAALTAVVDAVAENPVDVVATLGLALGGDAVEGHDRAGGGGGSVSFVSFVPMAELLEGVDVVVGVGGAGTVLAALDRGLPLVIWPQGADHPVTAAGVVAAGAGVVVDSAQDIKAAVAQVLVDDRYRRHAGEVAASMARAASADEAIRAVTAR